MAEVKKQEERKFNVTDVAFEKIREILKANDGKFLRLSVVHGGCQGMQYAFSVEKEKEEGDFSLGEGSEDLLIIDEMSIEELNGGTLDFVDGINGSYFRIINPNAESGCGCGNSFKSKKSDKMG